MGNKCGEIMRSVTIDECTEGYLIKTGGTFKTFAVSKDKLIQKVKELLGIIDRRTGPRADSSGASLTLALVGNSASMDADSTSTYSGANVTEIDSVKPERPATETNSQSKIETKLSPSSPTFKFEEIAAFVFSGQPKTVGKSIYWLHPDDKKIRISRVGYLLFVHANISDLVYLYEHPAEQTAILHAYSVATYVNKAVILRGFLKAVPLSALVGDNHNDDAVLAPLEPLAKKNEPKGKGQEDGTCDDVAFESCANNKPENCKHCVNESRYENKNKLDAKKPAPPLMRASVPP
jgi:hypothetical protein